MKKNRLNILKIEKLRHQQDDNSDYARYRAKREEQAAYDDFIASLDMDDK